MSAESIHIPSNAGTNHLRIHRSGSVDIDVGRLAAQALKETVAASTASHGASSSDLPLDGLRPASADELAAIMRDVQSLRLGQGHDDGTTRASAVPQLSSAPIASAAPSLPFPLSNGSVAALNSGLGGGDGSGSSSTALISAMQALQEKIRKLETERDNYASQCHNLEATFRKEQTELTRRAEELTASTDAKVRETHKQLEERGTEVIEVSTRAIKAEEQVKALLKELEFVKERSNESDEGRRKAEAKVAALETKVGSLEAELLDLRDKLRVAEHASRNSSTHHSHTLSAVEDEKAELSRQLERERALRRDLEARKLKAEEMLRTTLALNERLVAQVQEHRSAQQETALAGGDGGRRKGRASRHKAKAKRVSSVSSSLARSTASTRAKGVSMKAGSGASSALSTAVAAPMVRRAAARKRKPAAARRRHKHQNVHEELVEANMGRHVCQANPLVLNSRARWSHIAHSETDRAVPFLLGKSSEPSFSVYGQVQSGIHDDGAYGNAASKLPPPPPVVIREVEVTTAGSQRQPSFGMDFTSSPSMRATGVPAADPSSPGKGVLAYPPSHPHNHSADAEALKASDLEIDNVVGSLEKELEGLNAQYKSMLSTVSLSASAFSLGTLMHRCKCSVSASTNAANDAFARFFVLQGGDGNESDLDKTLGTLIEAIDVKGQQVHMLRRCRDVMRESRGRSPVRSPQAFDRKVQSLRVLHNFRVEQAANARVHDHE